MKRFLFLVTTTFVSLFSFGQCADCIPDPECVSTDGFPAICPAVVAEATAGVYYEQFLTFFLPAVIVDPGTQQSADLVQLTINSVSGLPFGMAYTLDDADGVYFPSDGQNSGCATLCGTPVLPGVYDVQISVTALVSAFGFEFEQNESFPFTLVVLEGEGGTESFSYNQVASCGTLDATFEATLAGQFPQQTVYVWDFGNGGGASTAGPHDVEYAVPGTYEVSLNTIISNLVLTEVVLNNLAEGWGGDADEFFGLGSPDPFFELKDGSDIVVYSSSTVDDATSGTWSGLNVPLVNPPYVLAFWDEDLITDNDFLGNSTVTLAVGTGPFNSGGGTVGQLTIGLVEVNNITSTVEVNVFPEPDASFSVASNVFTCTDPNQSSYVWLVNDVLAENGLSCILEATEGGVYQLQVTNEFGCTSLSELFLFCPPIIAVFNPILNTVSVPAGLGEYQWFFNGLELDGVFGNVINDPAVGNYSVVVTTTFGCTTPSSVVTVTVGVDEIDAHRLVIYPNPVQDELHLAFSKRTDGSYHILDLSGRTVASGFAKGSEWIVDVSSLSPGWYSVEVRLPYGIVRNRLLKS